MAVAPITLVAHTSLLTGLYPPRHGVRNNGIHVVSQELRSLPEILEEHAFETAAFVSASVLEARYGLDQGFDVYDDDLSSGTNRQPRVVPDRPAGATVDAAIEWLDQLESDAADGRFFLWVHFYDPHAIYSPPAPYRDRYRDRPYDGEIAYMDAQLGRLLEHPALEDTTVAVIGDHGEQTHAILAYQSTLHVPFLLHLPEGAGPRGLRVEEPVSQVDVLPTVLELLGLPIEGAIDGTSLLPLLETSERGAEPLPAPLHDPTHYAETYLPYYTYGWAKLRVLRQGPWKLIDGPDPELYDLARDAQESRDLSDSERTTFESLSVQLQGLLDEHGEREATLELDEEARARLRSLGYLASGSSPRHDGPRPDPKAVVDLHVGLERARQLLRERRPDEAERALRRVLARDPSNLAAVTELATAADQRSDLEGAVAAAERALELDPSDARLYVLMARLEARRERPAQALELLDAALEIMPQHLEARLERASLLHQQGKTDEAQREIEHLRQTEGDHPRVLLARAALPARPASTAPSPEELVRQALEADPFLVQGWRQLGRLLERERRTAEAIAAYRAGLERAPDDGLLHGALGQLLARTGGDAEIHLREALRLAGRPRPDLSVTLGAHLAERGRLSEALVLYDEALFADPGHLAARNNRAVALYRSGRGDEALRELEALANEYPQHVDAHNNLAALALDRGRWREAAAHARRALQAAPDHANAWLNLGLAEHEQGRADQAERAYRRSLSLSPEHVMARFHLGRLLVALENPRVDESVELLRQVAAAAPTFAEPHLLLGDLYAGPLAQPRRARAHLNTFLRLVTAGGTSANPAADSATLSRPHDPRVADVRRRLAELSLAN